MFLIFMSLNKNKGWYAIKPNQKEKDLAWL